MSKENTEFSTIEKKFPHSEYTANVSLTDREKDIAKKLIGVLNGRTSTTEFDFISELSQSIDTQNIMNVFPSKRMYEKIYTKIASALKKCGAQNVSKLAGYVLDKTTGFGKLGSLLRDPDLEEIMINGNDQPVFVFHIKHGMCKTNISYSKDDLEKFINKIAKTVGKEFNEKNPLLDARLSDGSRANATYNSVTPFGHTLTIRKFKQKPIAITSMIKNNTLSVELAAFLWLCIEGLGIGPQNILVVGGTGSGKTSLLMALSSFIRYSSRIISIEDTPELNLQDRANWISMETRAKTEITPEIEMEDLLKNAMRMRPDRILIGEVRGSEANALFTAMDTGHNGIIGTLHANNPKETLLRLKSAPMSVPESNLHLLDLIVRIRKQYKIGVGIKRRVVDVAELERMDNQVLLSNIYELDETQDRIKKTTVPARIYEKLASLVGATKRDIIEEIKLRQNIIEHMIDNKIFDYIEVTKYCQKYYENPEKIIAELSDK